MVSITRYQCCAKGSGCCEDEKRILRECVVCRRHQARPFSPQPTPDLPKIRVDDAPPFVNTGLDFLGSLYITEKNATEGTSSSKVYVCLFTCAATRAVHLELTRVLSTQAFLLSFRRFTFGFDIRQRDDVQICVQGSRTNL